MYCTLEYSISFQELNAAATVYNISDLDKSQLQLPNPADPLSANPAANAPDQLITGHDQLIGGHVYRETFNPSNLQHNYIYDQQVDIDRLN